MNMVERMAVAMSNSKAWPVVYPAGTARVLALAALKAMRHPSEKMVGAGMLLAETDLASEYTAMIDAAIKEAESE